MNLKNYTSSVPSDTSVARIERLLVNAGATGIIKEYTNGKCTALVFQIAFDANKPSMVVKLHANVNACWQSMWKEHCRTRTTRSQKTDRDFLPQAERTAWRIMQDWVEIQVSLMRLRKIDAVQAFLAYCWDGQQTVYERVREGGFKALLPPSGT